MEERYEIQAAPRIMDIINNQRVLPRKNYVKYWSNGFDVTQATVSRDIKRTTSGQNLMVMAIAMLYPRLQLTDQEKLRR